MCGVATRCTVSIAARDIHGKHLTRNAMTAICLLSLRRLQGVSMPRSVCSNWRKRRWPKQRLRNGREWSHSRQLRSPQEGHVTTIVLTPGPYPWEDGFGRYRHSARATPKLWEANSWSTDDCSHSNAEDLVYSEELDDPSEPGLIWTRASRVSSLLERPVHVFHRVSMLLNAPVRCALAWLRSNAPSLLRRTSS